MSFCALEIERQGGKTWVIFSEIPYTLNFL